jgi:catechol 2,3-dioxygenase-like lactoylglutathione lyase family enzyme
MSVTGINHINVRTDDIASSAAFFEEVLGLKFREVSLPSGNTGCWLYDDCDNPIIHLRIKDTEGESTGALDHIALNCTNKAAVIKQLDKKSIDYRVINNLVSDGLTQLFFTDIHGLTWELNFYD